MVNARTETSGTVGIGHDKTKKITGRFYKYYSTFKSLYLILLPVVHKIDVRKMNPFRRLFMHILKSSLCSAFESCEPLFLTAHDALNGYR